MTNEGDSSNPEIYRGVGTTGYFAPVSAEYPADIYEANLFRRSSR